MKVLVTGGLGFIGSYVVEELVSRGYSVNVLDLKSGVFKPPEGVVVFYGSADDADIVNEAMCDCEMVFHLASVVGVEKATQMGLNVLMVNLSMLKTVLECAVTKGVKKFIFSSSSEVFGRAVEFPITENSMIAPLTPYGISKAVGERLLELMHIKFGLEYSIVRYFNVYGPRQRTDFVVPRFIERIRSGLPVPVYDKQSTRDFTFVRDVAKATVLSAERSGCNIYNLGTGVETSILSLIALLEKISLRKADISFELNNNRAVEYEICRRVTSIDKARRELGYNPISLEEGLNKTWVLSL